MTPNLDLSPVPPGASGREGQPPPTHNSALTTLTNYLIVSSLLVCLVIGVVQLGLQLALTWNAGYIPLLCFLVALEAAYMTRYIRYGKLPVPWYVLRGAEALVLLFMVRSLLGVLRGPQLNENINPFAGRVDGELLVLVLITALTWISSWRLTSDLLDLETLDPSLDREIIREVAEAQVETRRELIRFTLMGGVALTFLAGLLRLYLRTSSSTVEVPAYGLGHVVVYFFLALVLFSRTRLNLLRSGWSWERVPIGREVGARWITYTVLLLAATVLVALVLPTRYSLDLLGTLGYILQMIISAVQLIVFVIASLLYALLSLFMPNPGEAPQYRPPMQPLFPDSSGPDTAPATLSEFVQSLIFWIVFLIVVGYVITQYLRRHPEAADWLKRLPGMSLVLRVWRKVRAWFGGLNQQFEDLLEARRRARRPAPARSPSAPRRWLNLRRLSPRQQVQFYYLAMLRRGGEHGHTRQPTQTPYEYARTLEGQIPEINQDVDGLTEQFIEARYSRHDIQPEHVSLVRRYWERIKQALKR